MKRFLRHILLVLLLSPVYVGELCAQDFYPLDSANTWSYRVFHSNYPQPPDSTTRQLSITTDTLMPNGHTYRRLSQPDPFGSLFVRLDSTHVYYYSPIDSSDVAMFNLRDTAGTVDTIRWGGLFTSQVGGIGSALVLGQWRVVRFYRFDGIVEFEATLADGFGIVDAVDWGDGGWPFNYSAWWRIRGCIIRDTTYGTLVDVPEEQTSPTGFALYQNYPNPFNPSTKIVYRVRSRESIELRIFDVLGREVTMLVNEVKEPGAYTVQFDASGIASGVYFYRLKAGPFVETRKMAVMR